MKYFRLLFILWSLIHGSLLADASNNTELDSLLTVLDKEIYNPAYQEDRERKIAATRRRLTQTADFEELFMLNEEMIGYYNNYQSDSLLSYLDRNLVLSQKMNDRRAFNMTAIKKAYVLTVLGIFHEASGVLDMIDPSTLEKSNIHSYYEAATNLYRVIRYETRNKEDYARLDRLYAQNRDSLLSHIPFNSNSAFQNRVDSLLIVDKASEALNLMKVLADRVAPEDPDYALVQFNYATALAGNNLPDQRDAALARSALNDIRSCTFENASLGTLATNLANRGDLSRANKYIQRAHEDVVNFNTPYRKGQLLPAMTSIVTAYQKELKAKQDRLLLFLGITSGAIVIIGLLAILIYRMMKRTRLLNKKVEQSYEAERSLNVKLQEANGKLHNVNTQLTTSNSRLSELNTKLKETNEKLNSVNQQLHVANSSLHEANLIKEECIYSFLNNSVDNLNKLEQYRVMVHTKLLNKQYSELTELVKSKSFARQEADEFYSNFDRVILKILPTFIDSYNSLLRPECRGGARQPGSLTPEQRIFALIRLGIDNPADIAKLLRYSLSTIYNYRVKVRKQSREDIAPDQFEDMVRKIDITDEIKVF